MSAELHIQEIDLFEGWLRQYFSNGYDYNEILHFLDKNHNISISICTMLRKLKSYDLQRRHQAPLLNQLLELAYQRIISLTQGFGSSNGYHYIWHTLSREGIRIPRNWSRRKWVEGKISIEKAGLCKSRSWLRMAPWQIWQAKTFWLCNPRSRWRVQ